MCRRSAGNAAASDLEHVGAMHLIVRHAERRLHGLRDRRAQQRASVIPAALMPRERLHALVCQRLGEAQPVQDARGVRADLDAGADLAQLARLLVDVDVEARPQQRQRSRGAADAAADDRNGQAGHLGSALVGLVDAVDLADQRVDHVDAGAVPGIELQRLLRCLLEHGLRDLDQLIAHGSGRHLDFAGALHEPQVGEGLRQGLAPRQQAMVAQHQDRLAVHALQHARALVGLHRDAFEVVVGDLAVELGGVEVGHRQPALGAGHRQPRGGVGVHDAMGLVDVPVHRGVRGEARRIDRPLAVGEDVAVEVDLDEVRRGDLGVVQAERVDEQVPLGPRHPAA